ncbi:hypothetical protein PJ900_00765 (plasmid) [Tistrella mobilis]|nr:hypothetical protein [Tistrella mobilis]
MSRRDEMQLMTEPLTPRDQIARAWSRVAYEDDRRPETGFSVLVPHGWDTHPPARPAGAAGAADEGLVPLAVWSDPGEDARVEVSVQRLARELAPADWMVEWLKANGFEVLAARRIASPAGALGDVLAVKRAAPDARIYRLRSYKSGPLLFLVAASVARHRFEALEETLFIGTEGFRLTGAASPVPAEPLREVTLTAPAPARFVIPAIWVQQRDDQLRAGQAWRFANPATEDHMVGLIYVATIPHDGAAGHDELADRLTASFRKDQEIEIQETPLRRVSEPDAPADVREARFPARRADGERVRLELVIARDPARWSVFALLGNRPDPDPLLIDAINRRAFEIVVASFTDRAAVA